MKLLSISASTRKPQGLHRTCRVFPPGFGPFRLTFRQVSSDRGTLTLILRECGVRLHAEYSGPKCGSLSGSLRHGNEHSVSIKSVEFLDTFGDYNLLEYNSATFSYTGINICKYYTN